MSENTGKNKGPNGGKQESIPQGVVATWPEKAERLGKDEVSGEEQAAAFWEKFIKGKDFNKGTEDMEIVQDEQAQAIKMPEGQETGAHEEAPSMPRLDYAGLNRYKAALQEQGSDQGQMAAQQSSREMPQTQEQGQEQGQQPDNDENPDAASAQEQFKDIKDGDTYTDSKGEKWKWATIEFNIVPEEMKDDEVDSLEDEKAEEEEEGEVDSGEPQTERIEQEVGVVADEADKIVFDAFCDALGITGIAEDVDFKDPEELTKKRQGYIVNDFKKIPYYLKKKNKFRQLADGTYFVMSYLGNAQKKAMENAKRSHRRHVAATYEKCRAKDKAKCPYHGAAYMTAQLGKILQSHGIPPGKFGVLQEDPPQRTEQTGKSPLPYRLLFSVPAGTPPEVQKQIAKEFFEKNPNILVEAKEKWYAELGNNAVFHQKGIERDIDDLPIDSPSEADYAARHDTAKEREYMEDSKAEGAVSWTSFDQLRLSSYFNMLSERPTNMVECADDMMRYATQFPENLPDGLNIDKVKKAYDIFIKANAKQKGLQSYLLNGETVNKADALAEAAQKGLEKNASAYYDAAEEVYNIAKEVVNNVEDSLKDQCWNLLWEMQSMPSADSVTGLKSANTKYFGDKYRITGDEFPINVGGEREDILREAMNDYGERWRKASTMFDYIKMGCRQREPLLVEYGIKRLRVNVEALKRSADILGEIQDDIIEDQSERWHKIHKIHTPGKSTMKESVEEREINVAKQPEEVQKPEKGGASPVEPQTPAVPQGKKRKGQQRKEQSQAEVENVEQEVGAPPPRVEEPPKEPERRAEREVMNRPITRQPIKEEPAKSDGEGVKIVQSIQLKDKPTLADAMEANKQFSALEGRLQDLVDIYRDQTPDSPEYRNAESEMKVIKSEIDKLMKEGRGKGYMWIKDTPKFIEGVSDKRPLDVPTNFRIASIKGSDGKETRVPYRKPEKQAKVGQESNGAEEENIDYGKAFEEINAKIGKTKDGSTFADLIDDGYDVVPYRDKKTGVRAYLLAKRGGNNVANIDTTQPYWNLNKVYAAEIGEEGDKAGLRNFVKSLEWKVKKVGNQKSLEKELYGGL